MYLVQQLDFMKRNFYWIHICGLERQGLQEFAFVWRSVHKRVFLRTSLSAIYSSKTKQAMELIERYVSRCLVPFNRENNPDGNVR